MLKKMGILVLVIFLVTGCTNELEETYAELENEIERYENVQRKFDNQTEQLTELTVQLQSKNEEIKALKRELSIIEDNIDESELNVSADNLFIQKMGDRLSLEIMGFNQVVYEVNNRESINLGIMLDDSLNWLDGSVLGNYEYKNMFRDSELLSGLYEGDYYFYQQNGEVSLVQGAFEDGDQVNIRLDNIHEPGIYTSYEGDFIPRDVETHVWFKDKDVDFEVIIESELDTELIKYRLGMVSLDIVQAYTCDLNGDGSQETIINMNDSFANKDFIFKNYMDTDLTAFSSSILILNSEYEVLCDVLTAHVLDSMEVGSLFSSINMIFDYDENGQFELLITKPIWEGNYHLIYYFDDTFNITGTDEFYTGM